MKAYLINLDRRPDRLEHMSRQLGQLGIPFERIVAVDGSDPAVALQAKGCVPGVGGKIMSQNAYACFQSHRQAWLRVSESDHPYGIVMEDDLVLSPGITEFMNDTWVPPDADFVKLETYEIRLHVDKGAGINLGTRRLRRLRSRHVGGGCYVLSRGVAREILAATSGTLSDPVDEYLFNPKCGLFNKLVIYQMFPAPAMQGDRYTSGKAGEAWAKSSMKSSDHFAYLTAATGEGANSPWRLWLKAKRRLREEIKAISKGTEYVVARHG